MHEELKTIRLPKPRSHERCGEGGRADHTTHAGGIFKQAA